MQEPHCSYYGTLAGKRYGATIGETLLDEMYMKILAKHEAILIKDQAKLITELRKTFSSEIRDFRKLFSYLEERIDFIEKLIRKENKDAIKERIIKKS